ncbi:RING-H2 finger protein ATL57-like [Canna indica]|uniref:RING-type E3 ubiquitin transferase n=1 Tax=Canna indica TaxID=4628 RepID=A0AAQ3JRE9_9LILI|nr:RING-H2 finger protein ATL57-like [Canna indica]
MKSRHRRLLLYETLAASAPPPEAPVDAQLSSSSSKPMAFTALLIVLGLFFFGFFSVYVSRLVSSLRRRSATRRPHRQTGRRLLFSPPAYGLDPSAVRALPVLRYVGGEGKDGYCVVCLSEFEEKERVKVIPRCGHAFHPACIGAWLVARGSCPLCRYSDMFGSCSGSGLSGLAVEEEEDEGAGAEKVEMKRSYSCCWRGDEGVTENDKAAEVCLRRTCSL